MSGAMIALKTFLAFEEIPWRPTPCWCRGFRRSRPEGIIIEAARAPMVYILGESLLAWRLRGNKIFVFPKN